MEKQLIKTNIGEIAVFSKINENSDKTPIIFLHGLYFDHNLWENQVKLIGDRSIFLIDMPLHGESKNIFKEKWNIDDCALMFIEILNYLELNKVVAVGHSWGSVTIVKSANIYPQLFEKIILCNIPFKPISRKRKFTIQLQHLLLIFKGFYIKQAGISLFSKTSLKNSPNLINKIFLPMNKLKSEDIVYSDKIVILESKDLSVLIKNIDNLTIAIVGKDDYLDNPPLSNVLIAEGGHITPLEDPNLIVDTINSI